jgi:hypothetical protein
MGQSAKIPVRSSRDSIQKLSECTQKKRVFFFWGGGRPRKLGGPSPNGAGPPHSRGS